MMRGTVCFLLLAGLICRSTSQNPSNPNQVNGVGNQQQPAQGTGNQQQPAQGTGNQQQSAQGTGNQQQPAQGTGNQQQPAQGTGNQQQSAQGTGNQQQPAQGTGNQQQPAQGTGNQQQPAQGTGNQQQPAQGTGNQQQPAQGTGTGNQQQPAQGTGNQQQPAQGTGNQQQPAQGTGTGHQQQPAQGTGTGNQQQPAQGTGNRQQPVQGTGNQQQPTQGTGNQQQPTQGTGNQQQPAQGTGNQPQPAQGTGNQQQPAQGTGNQQQPTRGTGNQQQPAQGTGNQQQPTQGTGNQQQPAQGTGSGNQQQTAQGTGNQQQPAQGTGNQQQAAQGTGSGNQQPIVPSSGAPAAQPSTTTTTSAPVVKVCPKGWSTYDGACYQYFGKKYERGFYEAEDFCRKQKGNLVSISNKKEYEFIRKEFITPIPNSGGMLSVWIGLYCKGGKDFFWTDGTDATGKSLFRPSIMFFKRHLKLATLTVSRMGNLNGYFGVTKDKKLTFLCEITIGGKKKNSREAACGYGWRMAKNRRCYRMFHEYRRFFAAERQCVQYNGHLASLNNKAEHAFVRKLFKSKQPAFGPWVGMHKIDHATSKFQWTDGSDNSYTPPVMFNGFPKPNPNFGYMCKNSSILDAIPYYKMPFVCERDVPTGCPKGWDRFRDSCYFIGKKPSTLTQAAKKCRQFKAQLTSICNIDEFLHLTRIRQLFKINEVWTGAYFMKTQKQEDLVWSDRRGCSYYPPGKYHKGFDKFGVLSKEGLQRVAKTQKFPFICKKKSKKACVNGFMKIYQHDDPLLLVTSSVNIAECKKSCLEKDGCHGTTFAQYQGNMMCYLHHEDGGQLPMMTSVNLEHWKRCSDYT